MDPAITIWFVVVLIIGDDYRTTLVDEQVSSIGICTSRLETALLRYAKVRAEDGWEVSVRCQLRKPQETPG